MFLCTHRHSNLIIFLSVEQRQAQLFHDQLPVGWGELIRFMFLVDVDVNVDDVVVVVNVFVLSIWRLLLILFLLLMLSCC